MASGGGSAPKPDPNIGIAALKSAETGEKWLEVAKEQFGVANERQDKLDALTSQVTNEQLTSMKQANGWAAQDRERYIGTFRPMEDQFIETANNWDSPERRAQVAAEAKADVQNASATARQSRERQMTSMGVNPASGRFAGIEASADTAAALASAGAQNAARKQVEAQGIALKSDAINMGRGLPSQATQALGLGVNTGNSVVGNNVQSNASWTTGTDILKSGYGMAMQGYGQQANILNEKYRNELAGWEKQQSASASNVQGLMGGIGQMASLFMSDEDAKTDKKPVRGALEAVRGMPVEEWTYKDGAGDGGRHIGTYAQDFQRETGKGDGKSIPVIDAIGVTMGAVKELDRKVQRIARNIGPMPVRGAGGMTSFKG
ncbi:MAG: tail fiber domain-containing protein [Pseudomonadota bacterium]